jgi:hypothetical protein
MNMEIKVNILFYFVLWEVIQPSAQLSPHLSTTKPDQELINMIEPDEFNQGTIDVQNTANNGDGGEHQDEKKTEIL